MERTHLKAKSAALRMYPRLASKPQQIVSSFVHRPTSRRRAEPSASGDTTATTAHAQMRLRLLNMIIENEKSRRHEHHAS